ncbi:MAG: hypothetical protein ABIJ16_00525, partial [Bacteroidota bacterium]
MKRALIIILLLSPAPLLNAQNNSQEVIRLESICSPEDDYAPVFTDSATLVFTSSRRNPKTERIMEGTHNMYISRKENDVWSNPRFISYMSNSDNFETSAGTSSDRKIMYIYKTFNGGDIYYSVTEGKIKGPPKRAKFNTPYHECAAFRSDNIQYFVTDKPGGKGGHDIYLSVEGSNGKWSESVNMSILNSTEDENHIFLSPDGKTIYFSSKGHDSKGGYDIFRSRMSGDGNWSKPENMGDFINTEFNEICFTIDPMGTMWFASDRPDGSGGYDIYSYVEKKIRAKVPLIITGKSPIVESNTGKVELIRDSVEVECYRKFLPAYIEVDISEVADSTQILSVGDLLTDENVSILDPKDQPVIGIKILYTRIENLTLEEVKAEIDFDIKYCKVQVGAFSTMSSIIDFANKFPMLGDKVMMIRNDKYN